MKKKIAAPFMSLFKYVRFRDIAYIVTIRKDVFWINTNTVNRFLLLSKAAFSFLSYFYVIKVERDAQFLLISEVGVRAQIKKLTKMKILKVRKPSQFSGGVQYNLTSNYRWSAFCLEKNLPRVLNTSLRRNFFLNS